MSSSTSGPTSTTVTGERADLLEALGHARHYLRFTARDLNDDQANQAATASALTIGGLVKHVTAVERTWAAFIVDGPSASPDYTKMTEADFAAYADGFRLLPGETLAGALAEYADVAQATDELVLTVTDLDASHELPPAPWNEPGKRWSARRVLMHIASETSQHAGHADIIRETLDGAKSMG